jgi:hypothetical protein
MRTFHKIHPFVCIFIVFIFVFNGCAAILKGNSSNVDFSSDPSGAEIFVNGNLMGKTPLKLKLESKFTYNIEFKKTGYETKTFLLTNSVSGGWIIFDIIFSGLIGIVIDAATNSWYVLDQDYVNAILEKQQNPN